MQIQPTIAAAGAAGSVSQASSKDRSSSASSSESAALPAQTALEKVARSEEASADRDAEGGMYGQANQQDSPESHQPPVHQAKPSGLPVKPPEPPSQLDIVG